MAKKHRLTHDQKRKHKLADRARRSPVPLSLAYTGNKFKTDELAPVYMSTETGIYEAFVMTNRELTDRTVSAALTTLIGQMQQGPLPPLDPDARVEANPGQEEDLIIWNIRRNWKDLFQTQKHPGREKLHGALRTLLGSIGVWTSPRPQSRGYLHYIEGFLKNAGVSVDVYDEDMKPLPPPAEDKLLEIGRDWCRGDDSAGDAFREELDSMIRAGQAERAAEICQRLLGETGQGLRMHELSQLALQTQGARRIGMR